MSTHCVIGKVASDSTVRMVYCHLDGGPDKKYPLLVKHLTDEQDLDKLLDAGDLVSLMTRPLKKIVARQVQNGPHILVSDHGEVPGSAKVFENLPAALRGASNEGAHYAYLWIEGMWISFREKRGSWETMPITPGWTATEMFAYCSGVAAR